MRVGSVLWIDMGVVAVWAAVAAVALHYVETPHYDDMKTFGKKETRSTPVFPHQTFYTAYLHRRARGPPFPPSTPHIITTHSWLLCGVLMAGLVDVGPVGEIGGVKRLTRKNGGWAYFLFSKVLHHRNRAFR